MRANIKAGSVAQIINADVAHVHGGTTSEPPRISTASVSKVLFLASNPSTTARVALDAEARDIEQKIRASEYRDDLVLRTRWAVRPGDLLQAMNEDRPTIVHFCGHGAGPQGIVLSDDVEGERLVDGMTLARLFSTVKDIVRIVVLNACHTVEQARAIAGVIDCVVGMAGAVNDDVARAFSASFYGALAFGRSARDAFEQGLVAIALLGQGQEDLPVMSTRPGVNAAELTIASTKATKA
jgi:hypothetical protein